MSLETKHCLARCTPYPVLITRIFNCHLHLYFERVAAALRWGVPLEVSNGRRDVNYYIIGVDGGSGAVIITKGGDIELFDREPLNLSLKW